MLDSAGVATNGLDRAHNPHRLDVASRDAAEDNVLAVEPRGNDGGHEELRAVAASLLVVHLK